MSDDTSGEQGKPEPATAAVIARPTGWLWTAELLVIAWLVVLAASALIIGAHDAVAGTEISVRLLGSLLVAGGVLLLSGAAGLWRRRPVGLSLAMIAALLGVAMGVLIFLTQVVNDEPDGRLAGWALIVVLSVLAAVYIRRLTPPGERSKSIWTRLPILKSAVSVGVLFSIAQFWYTLIYLPTTAPSSLTLEATIDGVKPRGGQLVIEGSVVVRNTSDTKVHVLASSLDVWGAVLARNFVSEEEFAEHVALTDEGKELEAAERHLYEKESDVVSHSRLVDEGLWFEPKETITVPVLTWVPKGEYNTIFLNAWISMGRGKVLGLEDVEADSFRTKHEVVFLTRVPEAGWLRRLTRGDRYVRVEYPSDATKFPTVEFAPDKKPDPPKDFNRRLDRFYGVDETASRDIRSLP